MAVSQEVAERVVTAGAAYWNQRFTLAESRERIEQLIDVVGHANEFAPYQWAQLTALALEFQPDCILEIGSGWGNSTCAFVDVANQLGPSSCRVISLDNRTATDHLAWKKAVAPLVPAGWLDVLESKVGRYQEFDYKRLLGEAERVLIFWSAAGFDVAESVLSLLLPHVANRQHVVAMHGISDGQFQGREHLLYGERKLWKGAGSGGRLRLGPIDSAVEQALAVADFATRNGIDFTSADDSIHQEITLFDARPDEIRNLLGTRLYNTQGHWYFFTLNDSPGPCTFPRLPRNPVEEARFAVELAPNEEYRTAYRTWNWAPQYEGVETDRMSAPASAFWKHREAVKATRSRFATLRKTLGETNAPSVGQLSQWMATALEFEPDLILEIGRGTGHSTCAFAEAAERLGGNRCRVVSVCNSPIWDAAKRDAVTAVVGADWFKPLTMLSGNVLEFDYAALVGEARRVLIFWRAENYVAAECVLGEIMPIVAERAHVVVLPELADSRYVTAEHGDYSGRRMWRGNNTTGSHVRLGRISSPFERAVAAVDFAARNELTLNSADESIQGELTSDNGRLAELRDTFGYDLQSFEAHWFWFTMNGPEGPLTFPKFEKPKPQPKAEAAPKSAPVETAAPKVEAKPAPVVASEPKAEPKPQPSNAHTPESATPAEKSPAAAPPKPMSFSAASLWNQRLLISSKLDRLRALHQAVGHSSDLALYQFIELYAAALEYKPDLILELGRGKGNSTCAFTEAAHQLGTERCRVISVCTTKSWEKTPPLDIAAIVPPAWFKPLKTYSANILDLNYEPLLAGAKRVLLFWDAHGFDIAECVLGRILPLLADREHLVIMHDLSDARYITAESAAYGDNPLWRGGSVPGARVRIGNIDSAVEQSVAILDFATRNKLTLHSADEGIQTDIVANASRLKEIQQVLGATAFSPQAHWFYFSLNELQGPLTFPKPRQRTPLQSFAKIWRHHVRPRIRAVTARVLPGRD